MATTLQKGMMGRNNEFYRNQYANILIGILAGLIFMLLAISVVFYQITHRPLPQFNAVQSDGQTMHLVAFEDPNLLSNTILQWASKAATVAYTFDFVNYNKQIAAARPYFTASGWNDYLASVNGLINTIVKNQLFINGVVAGTPVISNQGQLPGQGFIWRVQIPFLVTYQSANTTYKQNFMVIISVARVPTSLNPQGIGIDQFVMR